VRNGGQGWLKRRRDGRHRSKKEGGDRGNSQSRLRKRGGIPLPLSAEETKYHFAKRGWRRKGQEKAGRKISLYLEGLCTGVGNRGGGGRKRVGETGRWYAAGSRKRRCEEERKNRHKSGPRKNFRSQVKQNEVDERLRAPSEGRPE